MAENNNNNNSKGLAALTAEQRQTNEKLDQLIEVNDPTGARQTETRNEEAAGRKKELNYLKSMAAGITGLGKHFKGFGGKVGQTLKGFLKGTLMAAFLIALLAFLESDTWKEMKEVIKGPLTTALKGVYEHILKPIGRTFQRLIDFYNDPTKKNMLELLGDKDTFITIGALLLLLAPRTMFGLLLKGVPLLVAAFAALGRHLMRMITPLDDALPVGERAAMKAAEKRGKHRQKFDKARKAAEKAELKRLQDAADEAKSRRANTRLEAAKNAKIQAANARMAKAFKFYTATSGTHISPTGRMFLDDPRLRGDPGGSTRRAVGDPRLRGDPGGSTRRPAGETVQRAPRGTTFSQSRLGQGLGTGARVFKSIALTGGVSAGASLMSRAGKSGIEDVRNKRVKNAMKFMNSAKGTKFGLVLKILQKVAWPAYMALTGYQAMEILGSDASKDDKAIMLGSLFGGFLGAIGGATLGSIFGAAMGSGFLGIGAVAGGFIGGIIGGFAGSYAGEDLGRFIMQIALGDFDSVDPNFKSDMETHGEIFANMKRFGRQQKNMGATFDVSQPGFVRLMSQTGLSPDKLKSKYQTRTASTRTLAQKFIGMQRGAGRTALANKYNALFDDETSAGEFERLRGELGQDVESNPELRQEFNQIDSIFKSRAIGLYGGGTFMPMTGTSMFDPSHPVSNKLNELSADEAYINMLRVEKLEEDALAKAARDAANNGNAGTTNIIEGAKAVDARTENHSHTSTHMFHPNPTLAKAMLAN